MGLVVGFVGSVHLLPAVLTEGRMRAGMGRPSGTGCKDSGFFQPQQKFLLQKGLQIQPGMVAGIFGDTLIQALTLEPQANIPNGGALQGFWLGSGIRRV